MKTKKSLCFFVAILVALYAIGLVAATLDITVSNVEVDGTSVMDGTSLASAPGETVSVKVTFNSNENDTITDAKLKVYVDGYKSDVYASTSRFNILPGKTYTKTLSIKLPSSVDMDNLDETLALTVRIANKDDDVEETSSITLQKDSYEFDLLSVDAPLEAQAGDIIALDVVLANEGTDTLENSFVTAAISELGIQKKAYFGDIYAEDNAESDNDNEDARERRIYLTIPSDTPTGVYQIEVSASNYDASEIVKKNIAITGFAVEDNDSTSIDTEDNKTTGIPNSIVILTIVLVVIFVVLLVVLIILLTRKPSEKTNDFGETSYY
jgi:hypothetical protein